MPHPGQMPVNRRTVLRAGAVTAAVAVVPNTVPTRADARSGAARLPADPFTLGVASGGAPTGRLRDLDPARAPSARRRRAQRHAGRALQRPLAGRHRRAVRPHRPRRACRHDVVQRTQCPRRGRRAATRTGLLVPLQVRRLPVRGRAVQDDAGRRDHAGVLADVRQLLRPLRAGLVHRVPPPRRGRARPGAAPRRLRL